MLSAVNSIKQQGIDAIILRERLVDARRMSNA
jgi:hypothetical protein